jgi:hypothetical protein
MFDRELLKRVRGRQEQAFVWIGEWANHRTRRSIEQRVELCLGELGLLV